MAGLALVLDLIDSGNKATSVAACAAAVAGWTFISPVQFLRNEAAHCDAVAAIDPADKDDFYTRWLPSEPYTNGKTYILDLKPLFSAFQPKALATTSIRALLMNFVPLLEKSAHSDDDDEAGSMADSAEVSIALQRSGYSVLREVAVVTVRRILERAAVYYVSARIAWKLLKDIPKSAARKGSRKFLTRFEFFASVTRTAFRAHALGVGANWLVTEAIEVYRSGKIIYIYRQNPSRPKGCQKELEVLANFARISTANTLKSGISLSLAAVGAGCGAVFISPSLGTWIGLSIGDLAGGYLVGICVDNWIFGST